MAHIYKFFIPKKKFVYSILVLVVLGISYNRVSRFEKFYIDFSNHVNKRGYIAIDSNSELESKNIRTDKAFVKVSNHRVYMYSASIVEMQEKGKKKIVIHGWQHRNIKVTLVTCCLLLSNGTRCGSSGRMLPTLQPILNSTLIPKQYECDLRPKVVNFIGVSLSINTQKCPDDNNSYKRPYEITRNGNDNNIGVCSKFVYGSIDAEWLIEWFEVHRMFGVNKVLINTYELNSEAEKVLDYYESMGVAEITKGFKEPELETLPRKVGRKIAQAWMDESVVLKDCLTRLSNYKYVAVVDTDEYIVPSLGSFKGVWKHYLDKVFGSHVAGVTFKTKYHALTWGPTNVSSQLYLTRYGNATDAILDREKNIHMPSRVIPESVSTHSFLPRKGYQRFLVGPEGAVIHHFRHCRPEWMQPLSPQTMYIKHLTKHGEEPVCFNLRRYPSTLIQQVTNAVLNDVIDIRTKLNISPSNIKD